MWLMVVRRIAHAPVVLASVTLVTFVLFRYVGDPVLALVAEDATHEERDEIRERLGLDRPVLAQYITYAGRAVRGDLGRSYRYRRPVTEVIAERLPASIDLALAAALVTLALGVPLGIAAAVHQGTWRSAVARGLTLLGASVPTFVTALLLILVFAVVLGVAPAFGRPESGGIAGWRTGLVSGGGLKALVLPAIALGVFQAASLARVLHASLSAALVTDPVRAARARGANDRRVRYRHALRMALVPVVALLGVQIGSLVALSVAVETVFQWPGLGSLFVEAVRQTDIPLVAGCVLGASILFLAINLAVDILTVACDPRLRDAGGHA